MEKIYATSLAASKQGMYPGAGIMSCLVPYRAYNSRQESNQPQYGNSMTASLSLDLTLISASLIPKPIVKSAFSAAGSGVDTKIISRAGDRVVQSRQSNTRNFTQSGGRRL